MLKTAEKTALSQISLTGMRALVMLGLLIEAPRTLEEIKEAFVSLNIMEKSNSLDTLRIDMNTLRAMGCEIKRACPKTKHRYVLVKHPFALDLQSDEIAAVKKVYKKVICHANICLILQYDKLFKKIADYMNDGSVKEEVYGISVLKNYDIGLIEDLLKDCGEKRVLKLLYLTPGRAAEREKNVSALQLVLRSDKLYLCGYDTEKKEQVLLNVKRIKKILSRLTGGNEVNIKKITVKFFIQNFDINEPNENETVTETGENGYIVEGSYYNEFTAMQRILSFGSACTVIEPAEFKDKVIRTLKSMREVYND